MGPSGCGKSIFLKTAAGLTVPESGGLYLNGKNFHKLSRKNKLKFRKSNGFVFQDSALWANMTVFQNISLPLLYHFDHLSKSEIARRINIFTAKLGYNNTTDIRPANLSVGEKKLVSVLRALIIDPEYIFMDCPTMSVDRNTAVRLLDIIKELKSKKRTIIIATNDPGLASLLADYLIILKEGKLLEAGDFANVIKSKNNEVKEILSSVLNNASSFDSDLLNLLSNT